MKRVSAKCLNCLSAWEVVGSATVFCEMCELRHGLNCLSAWEVVGRDARIKEDALVYGGLNCLSAWEVVGSSSAARARKRRHDPRLSQLPFGLGSGW